MLATKRGRSIRDPDYKAIQIACPACIGVSRRAERRHPNPQRSIPCGLRCGRGRGEAANIRACNPNRGLPPAATLAHFTQRPDGCDSRRGAEVLGTRRAERDRVGVHPHPRAVRQLADAAAYYPQAAIIGGWAAANSYYDANKETLAKLIKGWGEANDYVIAHSEEALEALQKAHYSQTPLSDIHEQFKAQKMFTSSEWKKHYSDGTVTNWLQQSTDFFMANAGIKDFTPASKYFDPSLYLKTIA